ncbi:MAG: HU family DNA-binding protein [Acidobacteriota bacterium]|jgi:DNA-binding protein HU-beta|nr:HU family DNA-binding protein [Acidobacteriota bacterium]
MNKNELAAAMVSKTEFTKNDASAIIDSLVEIVIDQMKRKDGKLTIVGFGTFKSTLKKRKKGRNPRTGETIEIPARRVAKFIPGKKLKSLLD